jgi:signal transduction histidine kinase
MFVARPPEPRLRPCQPDEILRSSLRDLRPEAESRGVRLISDDHQAGTRAWADPDALRHLADVLLRNALESTPRGGSIHVSTTADAQRLRWSVRDTGRGLSASDAQHLFDPFYCGRQAGRGLGLGLPRAARIVAQSDGDLAWHSTPGQGTHFQLEIPLREPPRSPLATPDPLASRDAPAVPES